MKCKSGSKNILLLCSVRKCKCGDGEINRARDKG